MGFWNLRKNQKEKKESTQSSKYAKVKQEEEKKDSEVDKIDQLVERVIAHVMSPEYEKEVYNKDEEGLKNFKRGKRLLLSRRVYMPLFKKGLKQYIIGWKSATGEFPSEPDLYSESEHSIWTFYNLEWSSTMSGYKPDFYNDLKLNAEGKYNEIDIFNFFSNPIELAESEKKYEKEHEEDRLFKEKIEKLKAIANKPIKYGDSGKNKGEIDFDKEFNIFAEKLREQKMDEVTVFKLVTRMGELKKQYETVIRHPDKSLIQRLEAQVLLEYYEQIKKQKEEEEKSMYAAAIAETGSEFDTENLSESIDKIGKDVSTLTWLKIIDGIFGG